jgi:hypothetical protein
MILDFTEIPAANSSNGHQDTWEKFCRDFLESLGYSIISEPARGPDGGLDLKVKEVRIGISKSTEVYWLVSCKHYAHSSKSITIDIETDIRDRVEAHQCTGFIGLYSTIASSPLKNKLYGLSNKLEYQIFDNEKIENRIVGHLSQENLFLRYFPVSYRKWKEIYFFREPVKLFRNYCEAKYEDQIKILEEIFGKLENCIKIFRVSDSFEEMLKFQDVECILFPNLFDFFEGNFEFKHKKVEVCSLKSFLNELMPAEIEYLFLKKINSQLRTMGLNLPNKSIYLLYPNHLLFNNNQREILNDMFVDLKNILN